MNVFTVAVVQAASVADAQAAKEQFLAEVKQKVGSGIDITQVPDFADGAVEMQATIGSGVTSVGASAIYALDGTVGFGFSDAVVGGPAPENAALLA